MLKRKVKMYKYETGFIDIFTKLFADVIKNIDIENSGEYTEPNETDFRNRFQLSGQNKGKEKIIMNLEVREMAALFDYTLLRADATAAELRNLCEEAKEYGFRMVAINSVQTKFCKEILKDTNVHVGAAISFPLGQTTIETKVHETKEAIKDGSDEIDYVINIEKLKDKDYEYIKKEMQEIVNVCRENGVVSKVIFENCYLTDDEKRKLCEIALEVKPDYIKTSTGFGKHGATIEDVKLMKSIVGNQIKVKASGGIRTLEMVLELVNLGVDRIGLSAGVEILNEYKKYLKG